MQTSDTAPALTRLFSELIDGVEVTTATGGFVLNAGDVGLLRSLDRISAADASRSVNGGATIAAHAQHLRYGLSLMNRWAAEGGDAFADATWNEAWKRAAVDEAGWEAIRHGLRHETHRWLQALGSARTVNDIEFTGIIASIVHLAITSEPSGKSTRTYAGQGRAHFRRDLAHTNSSDRQACRDRYQTRASRSPAPSGSAFQPMHILA